jgi:2-(1,2-epoxy-1,2-dihydrophenyl)acetyl-CoA isomerase
MLEKDDKGMQDQEVLLKIEDNGVALLTLNRPEKYNAITPEMSEDLLPSLFARINADKAIRVLIITGAGKAFCSGADIMAMIKPMTEGKNETITAEKPYGHFIQSLAAIDKPVIAAINGTAAGAGFALALQCDIRIASDKAKFTTAFVNIGIMMDSGMSVTLPRIVGLPKAIEILMTGAKISAEEATDLGLATKVVSDEQLMAEAWSLAERLAAGPPLALSFIKRALYRNSQLGLEDGLIFETWGQNVLRSTKDVQEGITAFLEKRPPIFKGE